MAKKDEVEFVDLPDDGRSKFPARLNKIRLASADEPVTRWAVLEKYDNVASATDAANRMRKEHPAFEFASRSDGMGTGAVVYARFIGSV